MLLAALLLPHSGAADFTHVPPGAPAPAFSAAAADGRRHDLAEFAGKIVVLEWTSPVCPYTAVKYDSGAMQALQHYAAAHDVIWLSIDTAAADRAGHLTPAQARARITATHAHVSAFLFDTDARIARSYGARTTPSFFIIDPRGRLAYQGAMDEEAADSGPAPRNYVKAALDDLLAGRSVALRETQQRGCAVEY